MREKALVMIKPDALIERKDEGIKRFLISRGMNILQEKSLWLTVETLKTFYPFFIPRDVFDKMVELYKKSFAILIIFEGENALAVGQEAKAFFRREYGSTIHASDNAEEYEREINCLLNK